MVNNTSDVQDIEGVIAGIIKGVSIIYTINTQQETR